MIRRRRRQNKQSTDETILGPPPSCLRDLDELEGALVLLLPTASREENNNSALPESTFTYDDRYGDQVVVDDDYPNDAPAGVDKLDSNNSTIQNDSELNGLLSSMDDCDYSSVSSRSENTRLKRAEYRLMQRLAVGLRRGLVNAEEEREGIERSIREIVPMHYHLLKRYKTANKVALERQTVLFDLAPQDIRGSILISILGHDEQPQGERTSLLLRTNDSGVGREIETKVTIKLAGERGLRQSKEERKAIQRSVREIYRH